MLRIVITVISLSMLMGLKQAAAYGQTKATNYLVTEHLKLACQDGRGTVKHKGIIERDITGDGKLDLIIDHSGIHCHHGANEFCKTNDCSIVIYIRKGRHLKKVGDYLTQKVSLSRGKRPVISLWGEKGISYAVQWTGKRFQAVNNKNS